MTKITARFFAILCLAIQVFALHAQDIYVTTPVDVPVGNKSYKINLATCAVQEVNTCAPTNNTSQYPENQYTDIALDGQQNLYWVSGWGSLYKRKLSDDNSCQYLGSFTNSNTVNALVADSSTTLYAAGNGGGVCTLYKYSNGQFTTLGTFPPGIFSDGDLFFYEHRLFLTATDGALTHNFLVEVNTTRPELSCVYMELGVPFVFGAFSVESGASSKAYIICTKSSTSSELRELDIDNKLISPVLCSYPFFVSGSAIAYSKTSNKTFCHQSGTEDCSAEYFIKAYSRKDSSAGILDLTLTAANEVISGGTMHVNYPDDNTDAFLMKTNSNGERIWERHFLLPGYQLISAVAPLHDGQFIAAGNDNFDLSTSFFLTRFDGNGNIVWKKSYQFTGDCNFYIHSVKEDADGSIIAVAYHLDRCLSFQDRFVWLKFNYLGNLVYAKSLTPPGGINLTRVSDFMIKDGYSYLSGYYHDGARFKGVLMKIKNSSATLAWSKYYGSPGGDARFSQILPFGDKEICIIGSNSINYTDTSLIVVTDTSGAMRSSKYYTYAGNRDVGKALIDGDGNLTWFNYTLYNKNNNLKNDLTISKLHPINGIQWSKEYPQLYDNLNFVAAHSGTDGSSFFGGNHFNSKGKEEIFLGRIPVSGELSCTPVDLESSFGDYSLSVMDTSYTAADKVFTPIYRDWSIENSFIHQTDTLCAVASECNSLKITGPVSICMGDTLVLQIQKNNDCSAAPQFLYNHEQLQLILQTNNETRFLVKDSGDCWVRAKMLTPCDVLWDSLMIRLNKSMGKPGLTSNTSLCPGNTIILNAHKGYASYLWQDGSIDSIFKVTLPGLYFVSATDGCSHLFKDTVLVTAAPPIPFELGPDRIKCNNDTLHINAPSGFLNYTWSNNYNISSLFSQNIVVNPLTDTAYYVRGEKTPGCFAYDTIRVHVNISQPINLGADKSFCSGDSALFDAGDGFSGYSWSNGSSTQRITVIEAGSYSVIAVTAEGCKSFDTVKVLNVMPNPVVSLDHTNFLCDGGSRILDAGNFSSYTWNDGSNSQTMIVRGMGTYSVQVTDNNGCKGGDTARVTTILPLPSGFLPGDTSLCSYDRLTVNTRKPYNSYLWNTGAITSAITVSQPGNYWLQVKDANGCAGMDSILINPKDCMEGCYIPTAFTPNKDGKNDVLRPKLFGHVKKYLFTVYNRWGGIVFQTSELNRGWDGTVAGMLQDPGVFIWTCIYQFEGEGEKKQKGTVMLIR